MQYADESFKADLQAVFFPIAGVIAVAFLILFVYSTVQVILGKINDAKRVKMYPPYGVKDFPYSGVDGRRLPRKFENVQGEGNIVPIARN